MTTTTKSPSFGHYTPEEIEALKALPFGRAKQLKKQIDKRHIEEQKQREKKV